jgi:hypothetical protein
MKKTIQAVKKRLRSNRTTTRSPKKYKYLFKSVIFCAKCGYTLSGDTKPSGNFPQNYVHPRGRKRFHQCNHFTSIRCEIIDNQVLGHIFAMMGDAKGLERALKRAIPDQKALKAKVQKIKSLERQLNKVRKRSKTL